MTLALTLFAAGFLTILLPCILPLIPIVLGVSIAGRSKWRPLFTVAGMVVSFVGFTFLLLVVLRQLVEAADYMRIGTYYVLLLFGLGFLAHNKSVQYGGAVAGALFFLSKGESSVAIAAVLGVLAMHFGGKIATRIQRIGTGVQGIARDELGEGSPITAFIIGLTMGLVWVPCAGPALGFAFTLVREEPGLVALFYLTAYGLGTAVPLLIIGYGGQAAAHSVRALSRHSGRIKQVSGVILILTALSFQFHWFTQIETWLVTNTDFGTLGTNIEEKFLGENISEIREEKTAEQEVESAEEQSEAISDTFVLHDLPLLPVLGPAPELVGLGPWHNSEPLTLVGLKGKVVLVDFWTYSCINCIRTFPYMRQYWEDYSDQPFVLLGVHTPEFVFEKSEKNVADAIKRNNLTYPVAQDNDFETWKAFSNRYWPAKYLIDAEGNLRYKHFGEGAYEETDLAIRTLLQEAGVQVSTESDVDNVGYSGRLSTPETYLGSRSWNALGNGANKPTSDVITYRAPEVLEEHRYYLEGDWQLMEDERQVLRSENGTIFMRFTGAEINLVMGTEEGAPPAAVSVVVDGEEGEIFTVGYNDLFALWKGEYGTHDIEIHITGKGAEGYAFTFSAG